MSGRKPKGCRMRRARVALLVALAALAFGAGCSPPGAPAPPPQNTLPPPPTDPVSADGQPIENLCELLVDQDFATVAGVTAKAPDTSKVTGNEATCAYGTDVRLTIRVTTSPEAASTAYADLLTSGSFATKEQGPLGGVDESVAGKGTSTIGIGVRRRLLVFTIELPGATNQGDIKLIQLAGILLSRAHALGT
jgi:hypothetical protein